MTDLPTHPVPAAIDPQAWTLTVDGLVERPRTWDREALLATGQTSVTDDFACVEGWTANDLAWRGVAVRTLLSAARPAPDADAALVHAMDGDYACGLPIDRLAGGLLALGLNGEALPVEHGGPARLVLPGERDCWERVKWVSRLELVDRVPAARDTAEDIARSRFE